MGDGNYGKKLLLLGALVFFNAFAVAFIKYAAVSWRLVILSAVAVANTAAAARSGRDDSGYAAFILTVAVYCVYCYTAVYGFFFYQAYLLTWVVPALAGMYFSYSAGNHYLLFPSALALQNGIFNIYIDALNVNPAAASFRLTAAACHMPLTFIWLPAAAAFHKFYGRPAFANAYLVVSVIETALYIFLLNMDPGPVSGLYIITMFALVFAVYYFTPARNDSSLQSLYAAVSIPAVSVRAQIFLALIMIPFTVFALYASAVPEKSYEFECAGASLYYDEVLGYMARFRTPAEAILVAGGEEARRKYSDIKYVRVSAAGGWHIIDPGARSEGGFLKAVVTDTGMAGDQAVIHVEYPFSAALISEAEAGRVSNRFSYKLSAGVRADGSSFLRGYELSGDRFLMLDDDSGYNKFQSEVKNFAAVSNDSLSAAVYDYSGNIRVFDTSGAGIKMMVSDIRSMRTVVPVFADEFLVLTEKSLFRLVPKDKKIVELPCAPPGETISNIDAISSPDELVMVLRKGGALVLNASTLFFWKVSPPEGGGVFFSYFDGALCLWSRFFSNDLLAVEYVYGTSELSLVREASLPSGQHALSKASRPDGSGRKSIAAAVYSDGESAFRMLEFHPLSLLFSQMTVFSSASEKPLLDFDVSTAAGPELAALYAGGELVSMKKGWLYNRRSVSELRAGFKNVFRPSSPAWVKYLGERVFVVYDNAFYILDRETLKVRGLFHCAK